MTFMMLPRKVTEWYTGSSVFFPTRAGAASVPWVTCGYILTWADCRHMVVSQKTINGSTIWHSHIDPGHIHIGLAFLLWALTHLCWLIAKEWNQLPCLTLCPLYPIPHLMCCESNRSWEAGTTKWIRTCVTLVHKNRDSTAPSSIPQDKPRPPQRKVTWDLTTNNYKQNILCSSLSLWDPWTSDTKPPGKQGTWPCFSWAWEPWLKANCPEDLSTLGWTQAS